MIYLKQGDRGHLVREAQTLLGVTPDGIYGPKTQAAVSYYGYPAYELGLHLLLLNRSQDCHPDVWSQINRFYEKKTPYIWGGKLTSKGFNNPYNGLDCSGLATAVYPQYNPVMCNAQCLHDKSTAPISGPPRCGDLVFYGRSLRRITHVCIVVDNQGGIVGMIGGGPSFTRPKPTGHIQYRQLSYRRDVIAVRRPV